MKRLYEGDRIVVGYNDESVMGYFLSYYNPRYITCTLDGKDDGSVWIAECRRVSKAPADPPPAANIQIFEATPPTTTKEA